MSFLVFSERESLSLDTIFGDDVELDLVTRVDVALRGGNEHVLHQIHRLVLGQRRLLHVLHILKADLKGEGRKSG